MTLGIVLIAVGIALSLTGIAFAVYTARLLASAREEALAMASSVAADHVLPGVREVADMGFGPKFVDSCRYATCVVVVGADPDRPGHARVRSFGKETHGFRHEVLDLLDVVDCLRDHADDIEAVL